MHKTEHNSEIKLKKSSGTWILFLLVSEHNHRVRFNLIDDLEVLKDQNNNYISSNCERLVCF